MCLGGVSLWRPLFPTNMSPFFFTYIVALFGILCLGSSSVLLLFERTRRFAYDIAGMICAAGVWSLANAFADVSFTATTYLLWAGIAVIAFQSIASLFLVFVVRFIKPEKHIAKRQLLIYFVPTIFIALFAFSSVSVDTVFILFTQPTQHTVGTLYVIGPAILYLSFFYGALLLFKKYAEFSEQQRLQSRYIIIGLAVTLVGFTIFDILLPLFGELRFFSVGPVTSVFLLGCSAYAIFRHQLVDVKIVIQRSVVYTLLSGCIIVIYLAAILVLGSLYHSNSAALTLIGGGITTVIGVLTIKPLERWLRRITDPIFYKDTYDYAVALHTLSSILNHTLDRTTLLHETTIALQRILRADIRVEKSIEDKNALYTIPIVHQGEYLGTVVAGPKYSEDMYTRQDIQLLHTFAYQAAVALKKAELYEAERDYARELESKVRERTRALEETQQAQHQMLVDISHSLQTPLTVVKSELDFLKKKSPHKKKLAAFERSIDNISRFMYDLLKLARLESDNHTMPESTVDMSALLDELIEYFQTLAIEKDIVLETHVDPGIYIRGASKQLEELVVNLVSNAMRYIGTTGERRVTLTLTREGAYALLSVADTGIGISEDGRAHIFDRFYRASFTKKGTGLGLAIVKTIVEKHKGSIDVTSTLGHGSTFTVRLPCYMRSGT